jgi:hypothetical protein
MICSTFILFFVRRLIPPPIYNYIPYSSIPHISPAPAAGVLEESINLINIHRPKLLKPINQTIREKQQHKHQTNKEH